MQPNVFLKITGNQSSNPEQEQYLLSCINERLSRYIAPINEENLQDLFHFVNVKFLKNQPFDAKCCLSLLVIVPSLPNLLIAGVGEFKIFSCSHDLFEVLFQDPLNSNMEKNLNDDDFIDSINNCLGKPQLPLVMTKRISRHELPDMQILNYKQWSQLCENEKPSADCGYFLKFANTAHPEEPQKKKHRKKIALTGSVTLLAIATTTLFQNIVLPLKSNEINDMALNISPIPSNSTKEDLYEVNSGNSAYSESTFNGSFNIVLNDTNENYELKNQEMKANLSNTKEINLLNLDSSLNIKPLLRHKVIQGDTLSSISQKYFGTPKKSKEIFEANKNLLQSQNQLKPGLVLTIPENIQN
jgi:hypothetical protein